MSPGWLRYLVHSGLLAVGCFAAAVLALLLPIASAGVAASVGAAVATAFLFAAAFAERHRMMDVQTAERERLEVTLRSIGDGVIATDRQGKVMFLNSVAEALTGWSAAEARGRPVREVFHVVHEDSRDGCGNLVQRVLDDGSVAGLAKHPVLVSRLGTERAIAECGARIRDRGGQTVGVVLTFRDVTEQRQTEEALRESEERYRLITDSSTDLISLMDPQGRVIYVSPSVRTLMGMEPADVLGTNPFDLIHPEDAPSSRGAWARALAGETVSFAHRARHADGTWRWLEGWGRAVRSRGQERVLAVSRDVTQRKKIEVWRAWQTRILEAIATGAPLQDTLTMLLRAVEAQADGMLCSVLLLEEDGVHLRHVAAPSLPESYTRAIDGACIGLRAGSCGTAIYRGERVIVTDILTEPLWEDYRELATAHGLRACWSIPIFSSHGQVLGSFAMYYREVRSPGPDELQLLEDGPRLASIAIERQQDEEALRVSEARKAAILQTALDAVITMDHEGRIVEFNPAAERIFGYSSARAVGREVAELIIPPPLRAAHRRGLARYLATGEDPLLGHRVELSALRADGTTFPVELYVTPITRDGPPQFTAFVQDITERKQAEEHISLLQTITLEVSAVADLSAALHVVLRRVCEKTGWALGLAWVPRPDGTALECDPAWYAALPEAKGFRGDSEQVSFAPGVGLPGRVWLSRQPAWIRDVTADSNFPRGPAATRIGLKAGFAAPILAGEEVVAVIEFFLRDPRGEDDRLMKLITTVAAQLGLAIGRKRVEAALRQSEGRYRALVEEAAEGILVTDESTHVLFANPRACEIFGYSLDELCQLDSMLRTYVSTPEEAAAFAQRLAEVQQGRILRYERLARRKDGSLVSIEVSLRRLENGQLQVICRDVTERQRLEEQLRQAQKMEAIGLLAGGIAHDFNNLLTIINGYGDLLASSLDPADPTSEFVQQILQAGERAAALTDQLLAFSRKQVVCPVALNLNDVVTGIEKLLRRVIGENIQLVTALDTGAWLVKADRGQMEQVVMNLAVNARDAMREGGRLTITTRNVHLSIEEVPPEEAAPGAYLRLTVEDTGSGISPKILPRIFEPFFTTKKPGKGTGLGLATVYGIVKQSGGHITVSSHPGEGTAFAIYLPRTAQSQAPPVPSLERPDSAGVGGTVLLVEDEEGVRNLACEVLQRRGHTVLTARHGYEALALSRQHPGIIDLLVTDLIMPEMGGVELARQLTRERPTTRVLYISGYSDSSCMSREDLERILRKPFGPAALERAVHDALEQGMRREKA